MLYNDNCLKVMKSMGDNSTDSMVTDPPYGINYQSNEWDKSLPDVEIWKQAYRILKPGAYSAVFSSVRLMHRMMVNLEDCGFIIKDVMMWGFLNGMPKNRNIALDIDKVLGVDSEVVGEYSYSQGYIKGGASSYTKKKPKLEPSSILGKRYIGSGVNLKPAYEPIILIQTPIETGLTIAENVIKYGTGTINIEETRIPYEHGEGKVGHNPHPVGRVPSNIIPTRQLNQHSLWNNWSNWCLMLDKL